MKTQKQMIAIIVFLMTLQSAMSNTAINQNVYQNQNPFMSIEEIRPGQMAECFTILKGNQIIKLQVEILGVQKNALGFGRDLIVVRFRNNPIMEKAGIIAGMSGSPVYINGRLVGALSRADSFEKEPIGYLTPIKDTLEIAKQESIAISSADSKIRNPILFSANGLHKETLKIISKIEPNSFPHFQMAINGQSQNSIPATNYSDVKAGSMVGIQIMRGDLELSSYGTIVYRNGQFLYLFGHSMLGLGKVEYPVTKATVLGILPSYAQSYKISNSGEFIGTAIFDGFGGVLVQLGKKPDMVPISININDQTFHMEVIKNTTYTPMLINYAVINSLLYKTPSENITLKFIEFLKITNYPKYIIIEKIFSGNYEDVLVRVMRELLVHKRLLNNEFFSTNIEKVYFYIKVVAERHELKIIDFVSEKTKYSKGDKFTSIITFYKYNNKTLSKEISIKLPKEISKTSLNIEISSNSESSHRLDFPFSLLSDEPMFKETKSFYDLIKKIEAKPGLYLKISGSPNVHKIIVNIGNQKIKEIPPDENSNSAIFDLTTDDLKNFEISGSKEIVIQVN